MFTKFFKLFCFFLKCHFSKIHPYKLLRRWNHIIHCPTFDHHAINLYKRLYFQISSFLYLLFYCSLFHHHIHSYFEMYIFRRFYYYSKNFLHTFLHFCKFLGQCHLFGPCWNSLHSWFHLNSNIFQIHVQHHL